MSKTKYLLRVLLREKMPVWLVLAGVVIGAVATYYFAPTLNAKFEVAKAQAAYVTENLKGLNADTANLFATLAGASLEVSANRELSLKTKTELYKAIVILQWRANEYEVLFPDHDSLTIIQRYSGSIESVRALFSVDGSAATGLDIRNAAGALAASTRDVIILLSRKTEWSRTFTRL